VAPEWGLSVEKGIGAKTEIIPFTNTQLYQIFKSRLADGGPGGDQAPVANGYGLADRDNEYLPYAGPVPQGSTFLAHGHLGLAYRKMVTFGGHFLYSWTPDDNWHRVNSVLGDNINANPRASGKTKGSMTVFGGDVRLNGGVLGDGYIGYSRIDAKDINALADGIEVLHSFGGWQFKQNFFGRSFHPHTGIYQGPQNESGTVDTVLFQYTFSFGALARYPENFWGQGPDIAVTAFGMFNRIQSQHPSGNPAWNLNTKKLKLGGDIIYTPISWFGVGGRFDWVQPDLDAALARQVGNPGGSQLSFMVFSPRVVFRTQFVTHEAVTLQFQRYVLGDAAYPVYPYEWVPKADTYVFSIAGTMWW
jgi:hypothetical protein